MLLLLDLFRDDSRVPPLPCQSATMPCQSSSSFDRNDPDKSKGAILALSWFQLTLLPSQPVSPPQMPDASYHPLHVGEGFAFCNTVVSFFHGKDGKRPVPRPSVIKNKEEKSCGELQWPYNAELLFFQMPQFCKMT